MKTWVLLLVSILFLSACGKRNQRLGLANLNGQIGTVSQQLTGTLVRMSDDQIALGDEVTWRLEVWGGSGSYVYWESDGEPQPLLTRAGGQMAQVEFSTVADKVGIHGTEVRVEDVSNPARHLVLTQSFEVTATTTTASDRASCLVNLDQVVAVLDRNQDRAQFEFDVQTSEEAILKEVLSNGLPLLGINPSEGRVHRGVLDLRQGKHALKFRFQSVSGSEFNCSASVAVEAPISSPARCALTLSSTSVLVGNSISVSIQSWGATGRLTINGQSVQSGIAISVPTTRVGSLKIIGKLVYGGKVALCEATLTVTEPMRVPLYRHYNGWDHRFSRYSQLTGYNLNGVAFNLYASPIPNRTYPLYSCLVPRVREYFLSTDATCEGMQTVRLLGYVLSSGSRPIYRLFHHGNGNHFSTTHLPERANAVQNLGYTSEAVLGYAP